MESLTKKRQLPSKIASESTAASSRWLLRIVLMLAIGGSYAMISHSRGASVRGLEAEMLIFEADNNDSADRQASGSNWSRLGYVLLGGIGCLGIVIRSKRTTAIPPHLLLFLALLCFYVFWQMSSILWSVDISLSARKVVAVFLLFVSVFGVSRHVDFEDILVIVLGITLTYCVVGVIDELRVGTFRPWTSLYRFSGTVHANEQAMYSALLVLSAWCYSISPKADLLSQWLFRMKYVLVLIGLVAIYLTKSRTTLGSLLLAMTFSEIFRLSLKFRVLAGCIMGVVVCLVGFFASSGGYWDMLGSTASMGRTEHISSLTGRVPLWQALWPHAEKNLWMGYGYGTFWRPDIIREMSETFYWEIMNAHSIYLDAILNLGLVGLFLYLGIIFIGGGISVSRLLMTRDRNYQWLFGLVTLALIHGIAESKFYEEGLGTYCLMIGLHRLVRNSHTSIANS